MAKESRVKQYYREEHQAGNEINELHEKLRETILAFDPHYNIFEFGCGTGKNLNNLKSFGTNIQEVRGIDISAKNLSAAKELYPGLVLEIGDEEFLKNYKNDYFDVSFTCSVLDHIENISEAIFQLKRITSNGIVIAETQDIINEYYFSHRYENWGFEKTGYSYKSQFDKALYEIWAWKKKA